MSDFTRRPHGIPDSAAISHDALVRFRTRERFLHDPLVRFRTRERFFARPRVRSPTRQRFQTSPSCAHRCRVQNSTTPSCEFAAESKTRHPPRVIVDSAAPCNAACHNETPAQQRTNASKCHNHPCVRPLVSLTVYPAPSLNLEATSFSYNTSPNLLTAEPTNQPIPSPHAPHPSG